MVQIKVSEIQYQALVALLPEETAIGDLRVYWIDPSINDGVAIAVCRIGESGQKETVMEVVV